MIHAICDFCGKDCIRTATLITMMPFSNFARYHTDSNPYGIEGEKISFVMCEKCMSNHRMPNPYDRYTEITDQKMTYDIAIDKEGE